jgi:hypothetical protein
VTITADGSGGAKLSSADETIVQVMTNDDPGSVQVNGVSVNQGVYTDPTSLPVKASGFEPTSASSGDAVATFTKVSLTGNFFNAFRGGPQSAGSGNDAGSAAPSGGAAPGGGASGGGSQQGKNLVLTFDAASVTVSSRRRRPGIGSRASRRPATARSAGSPTRRTPSSTMGSWSR